MIEAVDASAAAELAELHAAAFGAPWTEFEIAKLAANPATFALVARADAPLGFVMAWAAAGDSEILTLAVAPKARRRGVGASLVAAAGAVAFARGAATMHLEVDETNAGALSLYAKLGFVEVGRRGAYYAGENGRTDALVLRRELARPIV